MGSSYSTTYFQLKNDTNVDITNTIISGVYEEDEWGENFRPDYNLNNLWISSGSSQTRREDVIKCYCHCSFTMTLEFSDGTTDKFRIHQKYAISDCCDYVFQRLIESHNIFYEKQDDNKLVVTIENTLEQLVNQRAEEVNRSGEEAMEKKLYEVAIQKFRSAKRIANELSTIQKVSENLERAEKVYKINNLNIEGIELTKQKKFEEAVMKFEEALRYVGEDSSLFDVESIEGNKNQAINEYAWFYFEKGLRLEADENRDLSSQAMKSFSQAKRLFLSIDQGSNVYLVELKMVGNKLFNEAVSLQQDALKLFENKDYNSARDKYKQALSKYKKAKRSFERGSQFYRGLEEHVKVVQEEIDGVMDAIDQVDNAKFREKIKKVKIEENTEIEEDEDQEEMVEVGS